MENLRTKTHNYHVISRMLSLSKEPRFLLQCLIWQSTIPFRRAERVYCTTPDHHDRVLVLCRLALHIWAKTKKVDYKMNMLRDWLTGADENLTRL